MFPYQHLFSPAGVSMIFFQLLALDSQGVCPAAGLWRCLFPRDSQCPPRALGCIAPLDEGEGRLPFFPRRDLDARDAAGMNAGAGVVIGGIGMELPPYALCADVGFQIHPFRKREVFIDGPVRVAGNDRRN
jgi:hypothetical protein